MIKTKYNFLSYRPKIQFVLPQMKLIRVSLLICMLVTLCHMQEASSSSAKEKSDDGTLYWKHNVLFLLSECDMVDGYISSNGSTVNEKAKSFYSLFKNISFISKRTFSTDCKGRRKSGGGKPILFIHGRDGSYRSNRFFSWIFSQKNIVFLTIFLN